MYCDAFQVDVGCVLMKLHKVITYPSRKFKVHEKNYPKYDIELEITVCSLKIWRNYLYRVHVDLLTDHKILQYAFTQKKLEFPTKKVVRALKKLLYEFPLPPCQSECSYGCLKSNVHR